MRYTQYIKVEIDYAGHKIVTSGVDRHQLNYNSHGRTVARYRVVSTHKVSYIYSAYEGYANTPYFSQQNPFHSWLNR